MSWAFKGRHPGLTSFNVNAVKTNVLQVEMSSAYVGNEDLPLGLLPQL